MIEITRDTELTPELIKELKNTYKKLYKTTLEGDVYIWHKLSRQDYKKWMKDYEEVDNQSERLWAREEEACRLSVVYPCKEVLEEAMNNTAGMATMLSEEIYERSGFKVAEKTEEV